MVCARASARQDAVQLLEQIMGQLVASGGSSSGGSGGRSYKPRVGCDITLGELLGSFEVSVMCVRHGRVLFMFMSILHVHAPALPHSRSYTHGPFRRN
jgi:hypothetical protein